MAGRQRRQRDGVRTPVAVFRVVQLLLTLTHHREVVQRVRKIRMRGTMAGLLDGQCHAQQPLGRLVVAPLRRPPGPSRVPTGIGPICHLVPCLQTFPGGVTPVRSRLPWQRGSILQPGSRRTQSASRSRTTSSGCPDWTWRLLEARFRVSAECVRRVSTARAGPQAGRGHPAVLAPVQDRVIASACWATANTRTGPSLMNAVS